MSSDDGMSMRLYGRGSVSEFLGDFMVYRGLNPCDPRLPGLSSLLAQAGLPLDRTPRKHENAYAQVVVSLLRQARQLDAPQAVLKHLLFIGDTHMSDAGAFQNLCQAGQWTGLAFIGAENSKPSAVEVVPIGEGQGLFLANRWLQLEEFDQHRSQINIPVDESTVVVLDLDKTTLGARGRNASVIDQARVQAVRQTVATLLGDAFDPAAFQMTYDRLNHPEFHPFTTDNQDYLAYVCLLLGCGVESLEEVIQRIESRQLQTFEQFIQEIELKKTNLPISLCEIHQDIYRLVVAGDPTPFKAFRRNEYRLTTGRMGCLPDETPLRAILAEEIVITQEVRRLALDWKAQGALVFGLSDKPDEASLPTPALSSQGWLPLHRTVTHIVGQG